MCLTSFLGSLDFHVLFFYYYVYWWIQTETFSNILYQKVKSLLSDNLVLLDPMNALYNDVKYTAGSFCTYYLQHNVKVIVSIVP